MISHAHHFFNLIIYIIRSIIEYFNLTFIICKYLLISRLEENSLPCPSDQILYILILSGMMLKEESCFSFTIEVF